MLLLNSGKKTKPTPGVSFMQALASSFGDNGPLIAADETLPTTISADPFGDYMRGRAADLSRGDDTISPEYDDVPQHLDPLAVPPRPIPRAPDPVDVAGIDDKERAKLEGERGPRIKENPKGWKGFGLGLAKGLVGLAEGFARSGSHNFMDALPSMAEGASSRIHDYQTNREDFVPFDEELTQRVNDRIRPLQEKYGQARQVFDDEMKRYGAETEAERYGEERKDKERQFGLSERQVGVQERQATALEQYHADEVARQREADHQRFQLGLTQIRARVQQALATSRDTKEKGRILGQQKYLDEQGKLLADKASQLTAELSSIDSARMASGVGADRRQSLGARYDQVAAQLDDLRKQQQALVEKYGALASEAGAPGTPAGAAARLPPGIPPERSADALEIQRLYQSGQLSADDARQALYDLGAQR